MASRTIDDSRNLTNTRSTHRITHRNEESRKSPNKSKTSSSYQSLPQQRPTSSFKVVQSSHSGHHRLNRASEDEDWSKSVQKASERRAIDSLNIIRWVSALSEDKVDRKILKDAALHLKPADYREDVIIERHSSGLCGYPLCNNPPRRPYTHSDVPQLQICFSRRKLVDVKRSGQFCSTTCTQRSEWYENSILGREPDWAKAPLDYSEDIQLLEEIEEQRLKPLALGSISSGTLDELLAPLSKSTVKEDLENILASLSITEHPPLSPQLLPASPRQTVSMDVDTHDLTNTSSEVKHQSVRWADDLSMSDDDDEPMLEADTFDSLGEMIKQQCVSEGSKSGSFQRRSQARAASRNEVDDQDHENWRLRSNRSDLVVYDVDSVEDRMTIDWAMKIRDELKAEEE